MTRNTLCGVCRTPIPGEPAGFWFGEPVDEDCKESLLEAGYGVAQG